MNKITTNIFLAIFVLGFVAYATGYLTIEKSSVADARMIAEANEPLCKEILRQASEISDLRDQLSSYAPDDAAGTPGYPDGSSTKSCGVVKFLQPDLFI